MILKQIVERTLPNGLKVICLKKTGAPVVSVQLWYKTGSFCESDGIRGISHILEHMMFRGLQNSVQRSIEPNKRCRRAL